MASIESSSTGAQASSSTISSPDQTTSSPQIPSSTTSLPSNPAFPPPQQPTTTHHQTQHIIPHYPGGPTSIASAPAASSSRPSLPGPFSSPTVAVTTAGGTRQQHISPTLPTPSTEREIAEARAAVVASLGNLLDSELQSRATILHSNATALDRQERELLRATDALRRENDRLGRVAEDAGRKVKLLGNVQNWAEVLERDFLVLEETVRLANNGDDSDGGGGGGCGDSCCSCSDDGRGSWSGSVSGAENDEVGGRGGSGEENDDLDRDKRMASGLDFMGRKFDDGDNDVNKPDVLDKGKGPAMAVEEGEHADETEVDGYGSHTAFSDTSRSVAEGESMNGTDGRAKESETTSLSTTAGGG